jgi:hypothetical protein
MPHPEIGDQTTALDVRRAPQLAQDLVARLESQSSESVCLRCSSKKTNKLKVHLEEV